jgi:hypothetical protein
MTSGFLQLESTLLFMLCLHNFQQDIILVVFIIAIWHHEAENTKTRPKKLLKKDSSSYLR